MLSRLEVIERYPILETVWDAAHQSFPVRVTRSFADRFVGFDRNDPLARQVLPHENEIEFDDGLFDPVGDYQRSPVPWVIRKHSDRALILVTKRCHIHCRYCFRRTFTPGAAADPTDEEWQAVLAYLENERPHEIILSGGDPLALKTSRLLRLVDDVSPFCDVLRIHTRAPITQPSRVTTKLVEGLAARGPVWVVVHANHPNELSEDAVGALSQFVDRGLPVLNQSVLLKGVNDDVETLVTLFRALVRQRILPYYLHHPDQVEGAQHFWISPAQGLSIYRQVRSQLSGVACPKYVIDPPDGTGKIAVADWLNAQIPR